MPEKNPNATVIIPSAEEETVLAAGQEISTNLFEEHITPAAIGAEAPPSVRLELTASGPFGAY